MSRRRKAKKQWREKVTPSCGCIYCDLNLPVESLNGKRVHYIDRTDRHVECTREELDMLPVVTKEQGLKMRTGKATPND